MITYEITQGDVETVACPLCVCVDHTLIATVQTGGVEFFTTAICNNCGIVYRRTRPAQAWYLSAFAKRATEQAAAGFDPINPEIEAKRYERYRGTAEIIKQYGGSGRVVDVGCGPPSGLRAFAEEGWQTFGIEPDASRATVSHVDGVTVAMATVEDYVSLPFTQCDVVTSAHSLEHMHDPLRVLRSMAKLVRKNGLVVVEVPYLCQFVVDWNDALTLVHFTNFTHRTLRAMGEAAGLLYIGEETQPADAPAETHIVGVFRRGRLLSDIDPQRFIFSIKDTEADVLSRYTTGLDTPSTPVHLEVPYINDLSLCFKGNPDDVQSAVHDNFSGRQAQYDEESGLWKVTAKES